MCTLEYTQHAHKYTHTYAHISTQAGLGLAGDAAQTGPGQEPLPRTAVLELVLVSGVNPAELASLADSRDRCTEMGHEQPIC